MKEVDNEEQIELSGRQLLNSPGYKGGGSKGGWKGGSKGGWKNKGNYNHKYKYKKNYDDDDWHDDDWCQYNYCGGAVCVEFDPQFESAWFQTLGLYK